MFDEEEEEERRGERSDAIGAPDNLIFFRAFIL